MQHFKKMFEILFSLGIIGVVDWLFEPCFSDNTAATEGGQRTIKYDFNTTKSFNPKP